MAYLALWNKNNALWYNFLEAFGIICVILHTEIITCITNRLNNNEQKSDFFGTRMPDYAMHNDGTRQALQRWIPTTRHTHSVLPTRRKHARLLRLPPLKIGQLRKWILANLGNKIQPTEEMKISQLRKLLWFYLVVRIIFTTFAADKTHWIWRSTSKE